MIHEDTHPGTYVSRYTFYTGTNIIDLFGNCTALKTTWIVSIVHTGVPALLWVFQESLIEDKNMKKTTKLVLVVWLSQMEALSLKSYFTAPNIQIGSVYCLSQYMIKSLVARFGTTILFFSLSTQLTSCHFTGNKSVKPVSRGWFLSSIEPFFSLEIISPWAYIDMDITFPLARKKQGMSGSCSPPGFCTRNLC